VISADLRELARSCLAEQAEPRSILCALVGAQARTRALPLPRALRLFQGAPSIAAGPAVERMSATLASAPVESVGQLYECLLGFAGSTRKRSGSFYTPPELAARVVEAALSALGGDCARACDPSLGGGVFVLALARALSRADPEDMALRRRIVEERLHGIDLNPLAVAVTEAALYLWAGDPKLELPRLTDNLIVANTLERLQSAKLARGGFDLVIGNPPWVAYAGRAAQPLPPETRRAWAREFRGFRGYRTLHGLFVERAAELAPRGVVALLLPSPLADLAGYAPVRRALAESHTPVEPMLELGQDAFEGVTQPCFALIATPGSDPRGGAREWRLVERQRSRVAAEEVAVPKLLERVGALPAFPRELFGEMGFQSAGDVSKTLLSRQCEPDDRFEVPLLEGREVREFSEGPPRLYLWPHAEALARARCRLRPREQYLRVAFVVRQTAKYPIAALHSGLPFRNTLLAGFAHSDLAPELVVALLNSTLYRALHLARRRDARQAAFPQVKIAHLRAMPAPPAPARERRELESITRAATRDGLGPALRDRLDRAVYALFDVTRDERRELEAFVSARAPELRTTDQPFRPGIEPRA
jgi:hypothetical protein